MPSMCQTHVRHLDRSLNRNKRKPDLMGVHTEIKAIVNKH